MYFPNVWPVCVFIRFPPCRPWVGGTRYDPEPAAAVAASLQGLESTDLA